MVSQYPTSFYEGKTLVQIRTSYDPDTMLWSARVAFVIVGQASHDIIVKKKFITQARALKYIFQYIPSLKRDPE